MAGAACGLGYELATIGIHNRLGQAGVRHDWLRRFEDRSDMTRIGTRAEVWFCNIVASFARYVAERALPESVPMLMRREAVMDSFNYAKDNMGGAYSFLDRFDGSVLSIEGDRR